MPEPVGRLIRRAKVERKDGLTVLSNAYPGSEFIRSEDMNFRPLGAETAPDGTMFLIDMHRGIIQQGNWVGRGSYLRGGGRKVGAGQECGEGSDLPAGAQGFQAGPQPKMLDETTAELVGHLSHPNGWWRDTAQKLIVLREDNRAVVGLLENLAKGGESHYGRMHALWTLEGMGAVTPELVVEALGDENPSVRMAAVRVGEPFLRDGNGEVVAAFEKMRGEEDVDVVAQVVNSIGYAGMGNEDLRVLDEALAAKFSDNVMVKAIVDNGKAMRQERIALEAQRRRDSHFGEAMEKGAEIYKQLCFTCHGEDGMGTKMEGVVGVTLGPPLPKSPRVIGIGWESREDDFARAETAGGRQGVSW